MKLFRFGLVSAAGFLAAGLVLYCRALTIPYVADDWEYLALVDTSHSIGVCFTLLLGRFVRPLVTALCATAMFGANLAGLAYSPALYGAPSRLTPPMGAPGPRLPPGAVLLTGSAIESLLLLTMAGRRLRRPRFRP